MTEVSDLMNAIVDGKPVDFDRGYADIMQDKITNLIANKKIEIAQTFFSPPEPPADEVETDDEEGSTFEDPSEDENTPEDSKEDSEED